MLAVWSSFVSPMWLGAPRMALLCSRGAEALLREGGGGLDQFGSVLDVGAGPDDQRRRDVEAAACHLRNTSEISETPPRRHSPYPSLRSASHTAPGDVIARRGRDGG